MWSRQYKINIITHKSSWFLKYTKTLEGKLTALGLIVKIHFSHELVEENTIAFYLSYPRVVPKSFLHKPYKSLVIHASDLPKGKGFSPWVWQILEGKSIIPVCLVEMAEELDAGPVAYRDVIKLEGTELLEEIREILSSKTLDLVIRYLSSEKQPLAYPQNGLETIYPRRTAADSEVDIHKTIIEQFNVLRVVDNINYPAFFIHKGKKYILRIEKERNV